jgi:stage II sporulation protein AA (anti-sigma F factor antagonist)
MERRLGELVVEKTETVWVLALEGEHDLSTSQTLRAELEAVYAHGTKVAVDLSEATFLDSSILQALYDGLRMAQEKAEDGLAVVAPPGSCAERILQLVGFDQVLPVYASLAVATDTL